MPKRVRLTERRRQAVDGSIPYPGNVNQPDRKFKQHDQYDNWEEVINHPLPDMRHDWKNDERDEIGFGIPEPWGSNPTVASVRVAANKAVKLAYLLLGNKVAEDVIEEQANDFMLLGPDAMDRTLARFAKTDELYAADGKEEEEKAAETIQEEKEEEAKKEASEALAEEADEDIAADGASEKEASESEASEKEASDDSDSDDEEDGESKEAATKVVAEDDDDDDDDDDEDDSDEEESKEASVKTSNDMDIELTSAMDDGAVGEDSRIAGLFDDDIPEELPEPGAGKREASSKKGIKSLGGGQPKVASGEKGADISSLWQDAPDVSEIFQ